MNKQIRHKIEQIRAERTPYVPKFKVIDDYPDYGMNYDAGVKLPYRQPSQDDLRAAKSTNELIDYVHNHDVIKTECINSKHEPYKYDIGLN